MSNLPSTLGLYAILQKLGQGGMATVYRAYHPDHGDRAVVKILDPELARNALFVRRFHREAKNAGRVRHPNIVKVYDVDKEEEIHYLGMEYVDGADLSFVLGKRPEIPLPAYLRILYAIAGAVQAIHSAELFHRDIKPSNIMIGKNGVVKLADFGLAKRDTESDAISLAGVVSGTPFYMAPELFGEAPPSAASDLYALGATFYEFATGRPPFLGETVMELAHAHTYIDVIPPKQFREDFPHILNDLLLGLLSKKPEARLEYGTALLPTLEDMGLKPSVQDANAPTQVMGLPWPQLRLNVTAPNKEKREVVLVVEDHLTIGRTPENDLQLRDMAVKRAQHASLVARAGTVFVKPSEGSLLLNEVAVPADGAPLHAGDTLRIGNTRLDILPEGKQEQVRHTLCDMERVLSADALRHQAARQAEQKNENLEKAREAYEAARPEQTLQYRQLGPATIASFRALKEEGIDREEAVRLIAELKGNPSDHLRRQDILAFPADFLDTPLERGTLAILVPTPVLEERLRGFDWDGLLRFGGRDWIVLKRKVLPSNTLLLLKRVP